MGFALKALESAQASRGGYAMAWAQVRVSCCPEAVGRCGAWHDAEAECRIAMGVQTWHDRWC